MAMRLGIANSNSNALMLISSDKVVISIQFLNDTTYSAWATSANLMQCYGVEVHALI